MLIAKEIVMANGAGLEVLINLYLILEIESIFFHQY